MNNADSAIRIPKGSTLLVVVTDLFKEKSSNIMSKSTVTEVEVNSRNSVS